MLNFAPPFVATRVPTPLGYDRELRLVAAGQPDAGTLIGVTWIAIPSSRPTRSTGSRRGRQLILGLVLVALAIAFALFRALQTAAMALDHR